MAFLGVPLVILCYCLVNLSFFAVLSYEQIESAEAVGLVCVAMHIISVPHINIIINLWHEFQVFGEAVIGKAGLVIFSLLVALATFGTAHSSQFTAARSA